MSKNNLIPFSHVSGNPYSLKTLVENRTVYNLSHCEMNLFETYEKSDYVPLRFNDLVVTSMLKGKKVMRLFDQPGFDYLPGESVIVPAHVEMTIDFPEASMNNPTQCLALAIDHQKITDTLQFLNEKYPKEGRDNFWKLDDSNYFFYNNEELALTINKLIHICQSTVITKDALADLALQELLIHITQSQTMKSVDDEKRPSNALLARCVDIIRQNLGAKISLKKVADEACLSTASLYRLFKKELSISPVEFIIMERIRFAKKLLKNRDLYIKNVSFEAGFDDCNYFIRAFKHHEGITPKQYQQLNNKD
jgi:AraC-like DNA-binding protein